MSKTTLDSQPVTSHNLPGKTDKAGRYLTMVSTSLGIVGALGTMFVWLAANYFTGDVVIKTNRPVESLTIKVYDKKGQEAVYHTPVFQLMPGTYHLEIKPDGGRTIHHDTQVQFNNKTEITVSVLDGNDEPSESRSDSDKHHWWQFWR